MAKKGEVNVLLIEDDEIDVRIAKEAFKNQGIRNPIHVASDGVEGLEMLRGENGRDRLPRPYLILLDLKMPRMTGLEFLDELRKDPELEDSIVFVLTTSDNEKDRVAAYHNHVAGYLLKSEIGGGFMTAVQMLDNYMISIQFPS